MQCFLKNKYRVTTLSIYNEVIQTPPRRKELRDEHIIHQQRNNWNTLSVFFCIFFAAHQTYQVIVHLAYYRHFDAGIYAVDTLSLSSLPSSCEPQILKLLLPRLR